jgi:hypothetical protein
MCLAGAARQLNAGAAPGRCRATAIVGWLAYGVAVRTSLAAQDGGGITQ